MEAEFSMVMETAAILIGWVVIVGLFYNTFENQESSMTRKNYKAMANELLFIQDKDARQKMAEIFANIAKQDNPRFDRIRFFEAAGL